MFDRSKIILVIFGSLELVVVGLSIVRSIFSFPRALFKIISINTSSMCDMCLVLALQKRNREYLSHRLPLAMFIPPVSMNRGAGYLPNTFWKTLTSSSTVLSRLTIFRIIYEVSSAVLTSVRSVQTLNRCGPWRARQNSLTFLILREGARYQFLIFLTCPYPKLLRCRSNIFWVGFQPEHFSGICR